MSSSEEVVVEDIEEKQSERDPQGEPPRAAEPLQSGETTPKLTDPGVQARGSSQPKQLGTKGHRIHKKSEKMEKSMAAI